MLRLGGSLALPTVSHGGPTLQRPRERAGRYVQRAAAQRDAERCGSSAGGRGVARK